MLENINLSFYPGAKIGVLGANGAGKSSLLRIMAGEDDGYSGEARLTPGFTVGLLHQEPQLDEKKDVLGNVMDGVGETATLLERYDAVLAGWSDPDADYDKLGEQQAQLEKEIEAANALGPQAHDRHRDGRAAPPARRRRRHARSPAVSAAASRCAGCCCRGPTCSCSTSPPTTSTRSRSRGSSGSSHEYHGTVVAVTHDRYFLDNVAGWILELDRGRGIPWEGNYSSWLEQKEARLAQEEKSDQARQRTLARELEWIRLAPRARQAKGKARINAYEALVAEAEAADGRADQLVISIPPGPRLGDLVVEAEHLTKGFGDRLLIDDFSFSLPPGGIVGVIGPNGAGKTTLFRMIVAAAGGGAPPRTRPTAARCAIGPTVRARVRRPEPRLARRRRRPCSRRSPAAGTTSSSAAARSTARAYVAGFNFKGSDQQKPVGKLSGGERNRVHLAKVLTQGGNVLLLDEPTNDLDVDTMRALEDALLAFAGLRGGDQPRPLVPRPHRHARARVRGRLRGAVVRGQLLRLRDRPPQAPRRRRRPAPPHQVQAARCR